MIVFEQCLSFVERCAVLVCIYVDHFRIWQSCVFGMMVVYVYLCVKMIVKWGQFINYLELRRAPICTCTARMALIATLFSCPML